MSVFGEDAQVVNIDRPDKVLGNMMTFNGNQNDIAEGLDEKPANHDKPVRRCPGYGYSLDIIEFLVDKFLPPDEPPIDDDMEARLKEIEGKESFFMRFVLKMGKKTYASNNKYFPHASEVLHPMDTAGTALGSSKVVAAGGRKIPCYGRCCYAMWYFVRDLL